jgi:predicted transcriptional regulator
MGAAPPVESNDHGILWQNAPTVVPDRRLARFAERLAKKENRTMSELIREALRQYRQRQEAPVNNDLIATLRAIQEEARKAGLDKLSNAARADYIVTGNLKDFPKVHEQINPVNARQLLEVFTRGSE